MSNGRVLYNRLLNYSRKFVENYHDREDIVSHFILNLVDGKAFTYRYNINGSIDGKLMRWLYRCVKNISISFLRKKNIFNLSLFSELEKEDYRIVRKKWYKQNQIPLEEQAIKNECVEKIKDAFSKLNKKDKNIFSLRYLLGFKYNEITEYLNIPLGTVQSRLHKSKKKIRRNLKNLEYSLSRVD